jgi:hypothetical protein
MSAKGTVGSLALVLACGCFASGEATAQTLEQYLKQQERKVSMEKETAFYCNTKALTTEERKRHEALTQKLLMKRLETIETEKGYELQFRPADVTVGEVAEWVVAESKCCPFFDFHIDLENEGKLVCLRLTAGEGVKQFIRAELGLK